MVPPPLTYDRWLDVGIDAVRELVEHGYPPADIRNAVDLRLQILLERHSFLLVDEGMLYRCNDLTVKLDRDALAIRLAALEHAPISVTRRMSARMTMQS